MRVDGFVKRFNEYRQDYYSPSKNICVDESISICYSQGGHWINIGLPMYVAIDRKPENGCEIQNAADGRSGIMLCLRLVTTAEESCIQDAVEDKVEETKLLHGTQVLKGLVLPWENSDRVVCADSYFASVGAAEELKRIGLRFIGVVKTATRRYPQNSLSRIELQQRKDFKGLTSSTNDGATLLAFVWMDQERRYFIATGSSLANGTPYFRTRCGNFDVTPNADAECVYLVIPQPKAAEVYYNSCAAINQHNRCRQDDLMLETKSVTHDWSRRVNMLLLGISIVDAWFAFQGSRGGTMCDIKQREFYEFLSE